MGLIVYENLSDALAKKIQEGIDITDIATDSKLGVVKVDNTSITIDADGTLHAVGGSGSDGLTSTDIADNLTTDDSTKVLSAKQGKVLKDELDSHEIVKATETVLGHITVDGTTIKVDGEGKISLVNTPVETPSTGRFTSTTKTDATHTYLYTPSIALLDSDDIDIIFNTTMLDSTDWELVDDGGNKAIKVNTNYYATDKPENYHVSGRIYRGFTAL